MDINIVELYGKYYRLIMIIASLVAFFLAVYFFLLKNTKEYYVLYWKGFTLIFIGSIISILGIFLSIRSNLRMFIVFSLLFYGLVLIFRGGIQKKRGSSRSRSEKQEKRGN